MELAAVVVFYNPTLENIKNIKNYIESVNKLYIIDNSEDDGIRYKNTKKINYIKLGENKGIAYALNQGAKLAIKEGYQWLLTLDQDSKMSKSIIEKMKTFLEKEPSKEKIGLVSPYQKIDNSPIETDKKVEEMIEVMTSGNILNLNAYQKIGGFKDWLFIDCVDTEYCMNLQMHHYKVLRLNDILLEHSLGSLKIHKFFGKEYPCFNHNPIRRYYIVRNTMYIKEMYGEYFPDYCEHLIKVQKGQVKRIILFEQQKWQKLKLMMHGYHDFKKKIKGKLIKE